MASPPGASPPTAPGAPSLRALPVDRKRRHSLGRQARNRSVTVEAAGRERYRVFTPFHFNDGDHLVMVLRRENGHWLLSDEGHTYMHLTYEMDEKSLHQGTRQAIITNALSAFSVEDREGELRAVIPDERYGDTLFDFIQAILCIAAQIR